MKSNVLAALIVLALAVSALTAADEPGIRPDPRPADLTTNRPGSTDEPAIRGEPRARDLSTPKTTAGRSTLEVSSLTPEQSERLRAIREKAAADVQAVRDRERAEIMAVLNEEQRAQYQKYEDGQATDRPRRVTITTAPATTQSAP